MGIKSLQVAYKEFGEVTTPQLHFLVANHRNNPKTSLYTETFADAFIEFCDLCGNPKPGYET